MRTRLRFLYGDEGGDSTYGDLVRLLDQFRERLPTRAETRQPFDERDVILITYGDTIRAADRTPLEALDTFATEHLKGLCSVIHLLPFFPYSSDYGFSVIDYLAVNARLGDWSDITSLHRSFKLMFDFVLNHVSSESEWFHAFLRDEAPYRDFFISVDPNTDLSGVTRPRVTPVLTRFDAERGPIWLWTTFSADQVDLNYANPNVLVRMIEVMLTYVERGADLLRTDAIGYLWKQPGTSSIHLPQTHAVVKLFRDVLDDVAPWVAIVTETNVPHADNVSYFGNGHDEAQMVYQFPLAPLVLDAFRHGDAARLDEWVRGLSTPSDSTTFFNFLASHDGIGVVPARGLLPESDVDALVEQVRTHGGDVSFKTNADGSESPYELNATFFDALSDPLDSGEPWTIKRDRFLCSQAIMLALAGVPGIYVHSLFGSHNDHAGYERSGWKRDLNHESLDLTGLEKTLADSSTESSQVFIGYAQLLRTRRGHEAFHPQSPQASVAFGPGIFALRRGPRAGQTVLALHNIRSDVQRIEYSNLAAAGFQGGADLITGRRVPHGEPLLLDPYEVVWLQASPSAG